MWRVRVRNGMSLEREERVLSRRERERERERKHENEERETIPERFYRRLVIDYNSL